MRRIGLLGFSLALFLASDAAMACDSGYDGNRRLESEILNYYNADVVFLARIGDVKPAPRATDASPWLWYGSYEILEVYRGKPASDGVLVDADLGPHRGRDGQLMPPQIPCMIGSVLGPNAQGRRILVFGKRMDADKGAQRYQIIVNSQQGGSQQVDNCAGDWCEDLLQRMRSYGKAEGVPLAFN